MGLQEKLTNDMKAAMKDGDKVKLNTIRMLRGSIRDAEIAKRSKLSSDEELQVIAGAAKKRKESAQAYREAGRTDLMETEEKEYQIISAYLPKPLSEQEVENVVEDVIKSVDAHSLKDLGRVMPEAMKRFRGQQVDGKLVQEIVRKKLA